MSKIHELQLQDITEVPSRSLTQAATPSYLLQLAVEQGADLDRLERLMALQERWEANEARKAYVTAMSHFKTEPVDIYKRKQVGFTDRNGAFVGYSHAELSDVTDAIGPAMARHGLSYRWNIDQSTGAVLVECIVTHELGHSESIKMVAPPDASGKKNVIQQIASAVTYLQRYTLLAITGMSTKGMDDDGVDTGSDEHDPKPPVQPGQAANAKGALPPTPDGYFTEKRLKSWAATILSGANTTNGLVDFLGAKYTLTPAQIDQIHAIPSTYAEGVPA